MSIETLFEEEFLDPYEQECRMLVKQMEEQAKLKNDPYFAYHVASNVSRSNKLVLGQIVINSLIPKLNYYYARDVMGADVLSHGLVVMKSQNLRLNYLFAKNVKGADIAAHEKVIMDSGDERYIKRFEDLNELLQKPKTLIRK